MTSSGRLYLQRRRDRSRVFILSLHHPPIFLQDVIITFSPFLTLSLLLFLFLGYFLFLMRNKTVCCFVFRWPMLSTICFYMLSAQGKEVAQVIDSVQFSSVAQSCLTLCDPMNHKHAISENLAHAITMLKPINIGKEQTFI